MQVFPKPVQVCVSEEEAMTAATIVWREAQVQRQLQQYMLAMGNTRLAEALEDEFMKLIGISNKLANSTRKDNEDAS